MSQIDRLIKRFSGEIGTTENPPNSNRTKYGKAYGWDGVAWCVQFMWWGFAEEKLSDLFYGGGKTASCGQLKTHAEKNGQWVTQNYKPGDLIIMDFNSDPSITDHIGFVTKTENGILYTIEGNTSPSDAGNQSNGGGVWQKKRDPKKVRITGAYRPNYADEKENEKMTGEEIYKELVKYLEEQPIPEWALKEYAAAIRLGITDGDRPTVLTPRYQAAIMAYRALTKENGK